MFKCGVCGINATSASSVVSRLAKIRLNGVSRHLHLLCSTSPTEGDLQYHLRGRAHMIGLERYRATEKSIYVRGFPNTVTSESLQSLLEQLVGGVKSVWLNESVSYALVEFRDAADALKALQMPQPCLDGKKLVIKPRIYHSVKTLQSPTSEAVQQKRKKQSKASQKKVVVDTDEILKIPTLDGQLKCFSDMNKMPVSAIRDQLLVTFDVLFAVRKSFPHCLVIPFGSVINEFGTHHSDCDLCLLTRPSPDLIALLTGTNYFSPLLLSIVEKLEVEYDVMFCPPPSPPSPHPIIMANDEMSDDDDGSSSSTLASPASLEFHKLYEHLTSMTSCNRISPIPSARCPIIRFVHKKTSLHCDICTNAILGPLNSRLMKAYCDFDHRVSVLVPVVKLWARFEGIPRQQLNSYALSLMVIYALQHSFPPVLPCLQQPDHWPRNMERCRDISACIENQLSPELTGFWKTSYTSPLTLQPSMNLDSTVHLLHHFFKFYDEQFNVNKHVISVRSMSLLTRQESEQLSKLEGGGGGRDQQRKKPFGAYNPLVVQDPFDLSHNVTKLLSTLVLKRLRNSFKKASNILHQELGKKSGPVSMLALFDKTTLTSISFSLSTSITLSRDDLAHFLSDDSYQPLIQCLNELTVDISDARYYLGHLILKKVVDLLMLKYNFTTESCAFEEDEGVCDSMEEVTEQSDTSLDSHMTYVEESAVVGVAEECLSTSDHRKRKRKLSSEEEVKTKRSKDDNSGFRVLDILYNLLPSKPHPNCYKCTAFENTWIHARRARRKHLHTPPQGSTKEGEDGGGGGGGGRDGSSGGGGEGIISGIKDQSDHQTKTQESTDSKMESSSIFSPMEALYDTLPTVSPFLQFQLVLLPPPPPPLQPASKDEVCVLKITKIIGKESDFHTFIAIVKKILCTGNRINS